MPITTAPLFFPNSQYRPNIFLMSMASANPLVMATASIVVDGVGVTNMTKSPLFFFGTTYYFEFDIRKVLQTYSAPKSQTKTTIFPDDLNVPYNQQNNDCHTYVGLIVSYYYNDPTTGLLTQFATIDTVPYGYYATNGTRQTLDFMGMDNYVMDTLNGGTEFLTNRPNPYTICTSENLYLSFIPYLSDTFQVVAVAGGVGINTGLASITPDATFVPATIGVGMVNLASQVYFDGLVNINNPAIDYYLITVGKSFFFGSFWTFVPTSQTHRYNIERECCEEKRIRLHWMNRLGGVDAFTFPNGKMIVQKTKSNQAQKPLPFGFITPPTASYDKGLFKFNQETVRVWEVSSQFYDNDTGEWLSELISSPEVYLETSSGLVSVIIDDADMTISESDELINLTIRFIESNQISTQQN
jgi:hypothetical protein